MLHIPYDAALWRVADARASSMPVLAGSHRRAAANQVGALGEVLVENFLTSHELPFEARYSTDCDLLVAGRSVEIKTKDRTVAPEAHFDCSVPLYNHEHQAVDVYIFVSLKRDRRNTSTSINRYTDAYLLGWASRGWMMGGRHWPRDSVDPENGTKFWTDCINRPISDLRSVEDMVTEIRRRLAQQVG